MALAVICRLESRSGAYDRLCLASPERVSENQWGTSFTPIKMHLHLMLFIDQSGSPGKITRANSLNSRDLINCMWAMRCLIPHCFSDWGRHLNSKQRCNFRVFTWLQIATTALYRKKKKGRITWIQLYKVKHEDNHKKPILTGHLCHYTSAYLHQYTHLVLIAGFIIIWMDFIWFRRLL